MNEKIKELADKAGFMEGWFSESGDDCEREIKKFARLIVAECISITDELVDRDRDGTWTSNELYTDYNGALSEVKRRITEHFGVEL